MQVPLASKVRAKVDPHQQRISSRISIGSDPALEGNVIGDEVNTRTTDVVVSNAKRKRPVLRLIPPCEDLSSSSSIHQSSSLSPLPTSSLSESDILHPIPIESIRNKITKRQKPASRSNNLEKENEFGRKKVHSNWTCSKAPPNILSLLRFDHIGGAPTQQALHPATQPQQPMPVIRPLTPIIRLKVHSGDDEQAVGKRKRSAPSVQDRYEGKQSRLPKQRMEPQAKPASGKKDKQSQRPKRTSNVENSREDEVHIVPLPSMPIEVSQGMPSSKLCKVLRIVGGLPRATPRRKEILSAPIKHPPVWAESRQELCEALPYYRSFQSGLYMHRRVAFGYLLEAFPAPRDIWACDGKVIISHGGGQCIRTMRPDGTPGPVSLQADQSHLDARVDTLLLAYERKTPIILIAGKGYEGLPWDLECAYVVLGWYWISSSWVEAEISPKEVSPPEGRNYFHRVKIRFDWIENQGEPWWINPLPQGNKVLTAMRESSPLTPLSSEASSPRRTPPTGVEMWSYDELDSRIPWTQDGANIGAVNEKSPKMDIRTLLNPSLGLLTPPLSSSGDGRASSTCDELKSRKHDRACWPGESALTTQTPLFTMTESSLQNPAFYPGEKCRSCRQPINQIYQEGLICLNSACKAFFLLHTKIGLLPIPPGFHLSYNDDFLVPRETPREVIIPYDIVPPEPAKRVPETEDAYEVGGRTLWRGWVCRKCGRANCRYRWEVWECRNCHNTLAPLDPACLVLPEQSRLSQPPFLGEAKVDPKSGIKSNIKMINEIGCICVIYDLAPAGKIYHLIQPHSAVSDDLLVEYQKSANQGGWFQRRALKAGAVKGQLLAQHFAVNTGASYKYQVDTLSYSFERSPQCVLMSLALITNRVRLVLGEEIGFNEILSVMYREGQKMSWHDDGETGLGPVVASLSLGSSAIMSFRPKSPNRTEMNAGFYTGISSKKVNPNTSLSITLSHGDIMIMQGRGIQIKYDHKVVPMGFRIASTARVIGDR
ncbi:uncharacterized protein IL334_002498 [Kwoniella shivajii]|uniref:Fe2OG dioxygenase domain-containing protein n=1 Tax=Kwoniella shivajii TaxID=564305 RepID=A0ABZ1CV00_9TREE|nr:hypothetical protein IL334_002498 [Kwoniella shivajii]